MAGDISRANLKKKGAAANPNGRPKREWTVKGLIEEALEEENEQGIPYKKIVTMKLRQLAARGDMAAIKEINQRLDGMPEQKNIQENTQEVNITIDIGESLKKIYGQGNTISSGEMLESST